MPLIIENKREINALFDLIYGEKYDTVHWRDGLLRYLDERLKRFIFTIHGARMRRVRDGFGFLEAEKLMRALSPGLYGLIILIDREIDEFFEDERNKEAFKYMYIFYRKNHLF